MRKVKAIVEGEVVNAFQFEPEEFKEFIQDNKLENWERKDLPLSVMQKLGLNPPNGFLYVKASGGDIPLQKYPNEFIGVDIFRIDLKQPEIIKVYHSYGIKN